MRVGRELPVRTSAPYPDGLGAAVGGGLGSSVAGGPDVGVVGPDVGTAGVGGGATGGKESSGSQMYMVGIGVALAGGSVVVTGGNVGVSAGVGGATVGDATASSPGPSSVVLLSVQPATSTASIKLSSSRARTNERSIGSPILRVRTEVSNTSFGPNLTELPPIPMTIRAGSGR